MDLTVTNLTLDDIKQAIQSELEKYFSNKEQTQFEDELGGIELAMQITGLAKPTIYSQCSRRQLPHSKRGKRLYFSRQELLDWIANGKRKTQAEIAVEAKTFSKNNPTIK